MKKVVAFIIAGILLAALMFSTVFSIINYCEIDRLNEKLEEENESLRTEIEILYAEIDYSRRKTAEQIDDLQTKINYLQAEIYGSYDALLAEIDDLRIKIDDLQTKVDDLRTRMRKAEDDIKRLQNDTGALFNSLSDKAMAIQQIYTELRQTEAELYAFRENVSRYIDKLK